MLHFCFFYPGISLKLHLHLESMLAAVIPVRSADEEVHGSKFVGSDSSFRTQCKLSLFLFGTNTHDRHDGVKEAGGTAALKERTVS